MHFDGVKAPSVQPEPAMLIVQIFLRLQGPPAKKSRSARLS
jgi:hypothetical protein